MDLEKSDIHINSKRKNRNFWLAIALGLFVMIVFLVTIAKLSNGNQIEGFDHTLRTSIIKD